jgi:hypothetical protein
MKTKCDVFTGGDVAGISAGSSRPGALLNAIAIVIAART